MDVEVHLSLESTHDEDWTSISIMALDVPRVIGERWILGVYPIWHSPMQRCGREISRGAK